MADEKVLVFEGGFIPDSKAFMDGMRSFESQLMWGGPIKSRPIKYYCYIIVDGHKHLAQHQRLSDVMYKVGPNYEETQQIWPKDSYTFDHYATLMEI